MKNNIIILLSCLLITTSLFAQKKVFKTKSIAAFKNGIAFVEAQANLDVKNNISIVNYLPFSDKPIVFGTIWFSSHGNTIKSVVNYIDSVENNRVVENLYDIIRANVGKSGLFKLDSYSSLIDAKIVEVKQNLIILQTRSTWITCTLTDIKSVEFQNKPNTTTVEKKSERTLKFEFEKNVDKQNTSLYYIQKGFFWTPNYTILLMDDKKASIKLRAGVINELDDINNADLSFIVGVPTFSFSNVESLFSSNQTINDLITTLNNQARRGVRENDVMALSNVMTQRIAYQNIDNFDSEEFELTGETSSDEGLYFYNLKNITLQKNSRAFFTLLETEFEYEQLYSTEIPTNNNSYSYYAKPDKNRRNEVWHSIKFKNNTKSPFTTGTVIITEQKDNSIRPISQNQLNYTPIGSSAIVKTTISPDISVEDNEEEVGEREKISRHFERVKMKGTITLKNYKNKDINLEIARYITGELQKSDVEWKTETKLKMWDGRNKGNDVKWTIKLKAGESKIITYNYTIVVSY